MSHDATPAFQCQYPVDDSAAEREVYLQARRSVVEPSIRIAGRNNQADTASQDGIFQAPLSSLDS